MKKFLKSCTTASVAIFFAACGADPSAMDKQIGGADPSASGDECPSGECSGSTTLATDKMALKGVTCGEGGNADCQTALDSAMTSGQIKGICVQPDSAVCGEGGTCWVTVELGCFVQECDSDDQCDDGNPCTGDFCLASGTCLNPSSTMDGQSCDDGNGCTLGDTCGDGTCSVWTPKVCSDSNVCNGVETCSPPSGDCLMGEAPVVDDGNVCTTDACDPMTGVSHTAVIDGTSCETDGHACTTQECWEGSCKVTVKDNAVCEDGNPCTLTFCSSVEGCVWSTFEGVACGEGMTCQTLVEGEAPVCGPTPPPAG